MKGLSTFIYGAIILLGIYSCTNEEEDIFGKSSAQRLNEAVAEYSKLLCSSENGWAMEYFANEKEKGYTLLMKFRTTGGVTIAAKDNYTGNEYTEDKSLFEVIADNAPVLTFNTYNNLLHYFSNPEDDPDTEENENGRGHEGDYEFIVMNASQDLIELKGKKRGYTILLRRLPEGQDWEKYLNQLEEVKNTLFSSKIPTLWLTTANGEKYTLTNSVTGVFDALPEGGDPISETIKVPFIMEKEGIRTLKPFTGGKEEDKALFSTQTFNIVEDGGLTCIDDGISRILGPTATGIFCTESTWTQENTWKIMPNEIGGKLKEQYDAVVKSVAAAYDNGKIEFEFKNNSNVGGQSLSFILKGRTKGSQGINVIFDANKPDMISFAMRDSQDNNWKLLSQRIPDLNSLAELFTSMTYNVTANSIICPTVLSFISESDSNNYFKINLD